MRYASVCSGVEAASLAWMPLGWEAAWFSEIEPFPCEVLRQRFPGVPNLGDMTKINVQPNGDINYGTTDALPADRGIDLIVGGTPCQDASVAGKREGLVEGSRSRLAFTFTRLAYELAAYRGLRWLVWENVPGVFSLNGGRDFAAFLSSLAGRDVAVPDGGWKSFGIVRPASDGNFGLCWRVLDVQHARVDGFPKAIPQRRRRVFLVGHIGSWERAAEVLFEPKGQTGDRPPSRRKGQGSARGAEEGTDGLLRQDTAATLDASYYKGVGERNGNNRQLVMEGCLNQEDPQSCRIYGDGGAYHSINANSGSGMHRDGVMCYTMDANESNSMKSGNPHSGIHEADVSKTLDTTMPTPAKAQGGQMVVDKCFGVTFCDENGRRKDRPNGGCYVTEIDSSKTISCANPNDPALVVTNSNGGDVMPPLTVSDLVRQRTNEADKSGGYVLECSTVRMREGCAGGGKGPLVSEGKSLTLGTGNDQVLCVADMIGGKAGAHVTNGEVSPTITNGRSSSSDVHAVCFQQNYLATFDNHANDSRVTPCDAPNIPARAGTGGGNLPLVVAADLYNQTLTGDAAMAVRSSASNPQHIPCAVEKDATYSVRRLLPIECERLMGFPDGWTLIPWRGKPAEECPDAPRYKACGNSFGVNCVRWIGLGIEAVEQKLKERT